MSKQNTIEAIMRILDQDEYEVDMQISLNGGESTITLSGGFDSVEMTPKGAEWLGGVLKQTTGDDHGLIAMANACSGTA